MNCGKRSSFRRLIASICFLGARDRHARFAHPDHFPVVAVPPAVGLVLRRERRRKIRVDVGPQEAEVGGQDADDLVGLRVELHRSAHDVAIAAVLALPEPVAEDDDLLVSRLALFVGEDASERGPGRDEPEERRRREDHRQADRAVLAAERRALAAVERELLEHVGLFAAIVVVGHAGRSARRAGVRIVVVQPDDPIGVRHRQRLQDDRPHDAEDRGVGADADRERQERRDREGAVLHQHARRKSRVLAERGQQASELAHTRLPRPPLGRRAIVTPPAFVTPRDDGKGHHVPGRSAESARHAPAAAALPLVLEVGGKHRFHVPAELRAIAARQHDEHRAVPRAHQPVGRGARRHECP